MAWKAQEKIILTLEKNNKEYDYIVGNIQNVSVRSEKEAVSIAVPGTHWLDNLLFGLTGMQGTISINAFMVDDDVDKSNGTAGEEQGEKTPIDEMEEALDIEIENGKIQTFEEQEAWLIGNWPGSIHNEAFDASWKFSFASDRKIAGQDEIPVALEEIDFNIIDSEGAEFKSMRIDLRGGSFS